jgi:hypothetical protein
VEKRARPVKAKHEDVLLGRRDSGAQLGSHAQLSRSDRDAVSYSACAIGPECPSGGKRKNAKLLVLVEDHDRSIGRRQNW